MGKMTFLEKIRIPTYNDPKQVTPGEVDFDNEKCTGCGTCVEVCPADSLMIEDTKARMKPPGENQCMFCGCCAAICPAGAVSMKSPFKCTLFFKPIDHGEPKPPRL